MDVAFTVTPSSRATIGKYPFLEVVSCINATFRDSSSLIVVIVLSRSDEIFIMSSSRFAIIYKVALETFGAFILTVPYVDPSSSV